MMEYVSKPVGYVRNQILSPEAIPYNGAPSSLELFPEFAETVRGLEPGYIWIVTWLHHAERRVARGGPTAPRGAFASRTPSRPNPVGLTCARLIGLEAARLRVDALDACDGTPVLDVKPYVREFDCVFGPADPAWRRADHSDQRLARLSRTIERFCGPLTPSLALAARAALAADRDLETAANSRDLSWECRCAHAVAAGIQAVAGAPLGRSRFRLLPDEGCIAVYRGDGTRVEYRLLQPPGCAEAVLAAPERELLARLA